MPRRIGGHAGFTLFEVIVVLLLLGLVSYFATTRLFSEDTISRASELELVKNHLRYAQSRAINSEPLTGYTVIYGIKFSSATRYWLYREPDENTIIRLPGVESADGSMTLTMIQLSPATGKVGFDKFGSPGIQTLTYSAQSQGGGSAIGTITITKNTGFIP